MTDEQRYEYRVTDWIQGKKRYTKVTELFDDENEARHYIRRSVPDCNPTLIERRKVGEWEPIND